ncbi:MAG: hypothetical protein JOZ72_17300 [Alphaproteobacteria bacterium]|nr:hypothetical protein [Alphaproteobacteria bacterium]
MSENANPAVPGTQGGTQTSRLISPRIAIGLVIVSMLSLIAFFALSAYAPDLRTDTDADAHALSKTAIGYAGLRVLLNEAGIDNTVERSTPGRGGPSLVVLTPPPGADPKGVLAAAMPDENAGPALIILPKWFALADPERYGRVVKGFTLDAKIREGMLKSLSDKTTIAERRGEKPPGLVSTIPSLSVPDGLGKIDRLQTISGADWVPMIKSGDGGIVLAKLNGASVYVLADPDLMNNHGLSDLPTAALAVAIVKRLRSGNGAIAFALALNGAGRTPSLLREMFAAPFLGATLCAIFAAMLIGFHAAVRFGTPRGQGPVFARGKTALVSNAADMIRMLHREPNMAPRYATTTRNIAAMALGIRRQDAEGFKGLEREDEPGFDALMTEAHWVSSRSGLIAVARRLYEWRERIIHAR